MNNFVISHHHFNALYLIGNNRVDFRSLGFFASLPYNVFKNYSILFVIFGDSVQDYQLLSMKPPCMMNTPYISFDKFSAACVTEWINTGFPPAT